MPALVLILAHFIADFLLQPGRIVKMKNKHWTGTFVHAFIHFCCYLILMAPFLPNLYVFVALFAVSIAHFIIDSVKIYYEKTSNKFVLSFVLDQILHLILIFGVIYLIKDISVSDWFLKTGVIYDLYLNPFVVLGFIFIILSTYGFELLIYQFDRVKNVYNDFKPNKKRMIFNLFLFGGVYVLFLAICMAFY